MADIDQYAYDVPALALIIDAQHYVQHLQDVVTWTIDNINSMGLDNQDEELYGDTLYRTAEAANCMLASAGDRDMLAHPDSHPEYLENYAGGDTSVDAILRDSIGDMHENGVTKFIRRLILRANISQRHLPLIQLMISSFIKCSPEDRYVQLHLLANVFPSAHAEAQTPIDDTASRMQRGKYIIGKAEECIFLRTARPRAAHGHPITIVSTSRRPPMETFTMVFW